LRWIRGGAHFANLPEPLVQFELETGGRPRNHWRYNLRARLRHLSPTHLPAQAFGVACAAVASYVPPPMFARILVRAHCRRP
jgi:hypothetical protein